MCCSHFLSHFTKTARLTPGGFLQIRTKNSSLQVLNYKKQKDRNSVFQFSLSKLYRVNHLSQLINKGSLVMSSVVYSSVPLEVSKIAEG